MMKKYIVIVIVLSAVIFGCGKKTEPVSKDSFVVPVPSTFSIYNNKDGVHITNSDSGLYLFVEKGIYNSKGEVNGISFLTVIDPKGSFIDSNIEKGVRYQYRLYNKNDLLDKMSQPIAREIVFNTLIEVVHSEYTPVKPNLLDIKMIFSDNISKYNVSLNGKNVYSGGDNTSRLLLEEKEVNEIVITPYDIYGNEGVAKKVLFKNPSSLFIYPVSNLHYIYDNSELVLSWEEVSFADGYKVYMLKSDKWIEMANVKEYYAKLSKIEITKCTVFGVSAYNQYSETEIKKVTVCP